MKILYGITKSNFGGAQRYVFDLARSAKAAGHDVTVLSGPGGLLIEKLKEEKINTVEIAGLGRDISPLDDLRALSEIYKVLRVEKPDVFHLNSSKMGGLGGVAARLAGTRKIIFTAHSWAFNESRSSIQKFTIKLFAWLTILLSHKTICVSEKNKKHIENWPFIKDKLEVIYNGVEDFKRVERTDSKFTVGTIAELHKVKGLDVLLNAWAKFVKNHEAQLIIIGAGEEEKNLKNLSKKLGINNSVIFKGFIENAKSYLSQFDIFVLPSRSEGLPYALLEAGISGLPVIASKVGGIPEIIETSINGVLVPKEDTESLFSSLVLYHDNPRMRDRLGNELKLLIQEKFSIKQMSKKTFKLYV